MPISRVRSVTGHEHDIHDADAADQKRDACNAAAEQRHQIARGLLLLLRLTVRVGAEIAAVYLAARLHELRERLFGERLDVLGIFGLDDILMVAHALRTHHQALQRVRA